MSHYQQGRGEDQRYGSGLAEKRGMAVEDHLRAKASSSSSSGGRVLDWRSPEAVAVWLGQVLSSNPNLDLFASHLPTLIHHVFGIPIEGGALHPTAGQSFEATKKKEVTPLLIVASRQMNLDWSQDVALVERLASSDRPGGERGLLAAVKQVRKKQHNVKTFEFPTRFLPESVVMQMMMKNLIRPARDSSQMMVLCDAFELLIYALAVFPIKSKDSDMPQESPPSAAYNGYVVGSDRWPKKDRPDDAYIRILHTYLKDIFDTQALRGVGEAFVDASFTLDIFNACWLAPRNFLRPGVGDPNTPGVPGGFRPGVPGRRQELGLETDMMMGHPTRRHMKAIVMLVTVVSREAVSTQPHTAARRGGLVQPGVNEGGLKLSWTMQELQPHLYPFLRLAFATLLKKFKTTKSLGSKPEPLEYGGELERYIEVWVAVTCPNLSGEALKLYINASFLFYSVLLIDLLRAARAVLHNGYTLWGGQNTKQHQMLHSLLDRIFDTFQEHTFSGLHTMALENPRAQALNYYRQQKLKKQAPGLRWKLACDARFAQTQQQQPTDAFASVREQHIQMCVQGGGAPESRASLEHMVSRALDAPSQQHPQGQEHDRVTLPGQLLDESRLLDDFALCSAGHRNEWEWVPMAWSRGGRFARDLEGAPVVVWQQLFEEVNAIQETLLHAVRALSDLKLARPWWHKVAEVFLVAYRFVASFFCNFQTDDARQLLDVVAKLDLFWQVPPPEGTAGSRAYPWLQGRVDDMRGHPATPAASRTGSAGRYTPAGRQDAFAGEQAGTASWLSGGESWLWNQHPVAMAETPDRLLLRGSAGGG